MNVERIKSFILFLLVTTSFVLTTRIWFNISIEGLFVMPAQQTTETTFSYEKHNLLKPSKLVVHIGQNHTLLTNTTADEEYYRFTMIAAKDVLIDWINSNESYRMSSLERNQLENIRSGRAIELIFEYPMQLSDIKSLLDIEKNSWTEISKINSIIIAPYDNKIYMVDEDKHSIYQFASSEIPTMHRGVIAQIEKRNNAEYVFLNIFNDESYLYGDYAIAPVSAVTMPMFSVKEEYQSDAEITPQIAAFFNDENANISRIPDANGEITFTDREEEIVTIDARGTLEYYKYNVASDNIKSTGAKEAIDIATQYVNKHGGFTHDFYLSGVESRIQGGRTSYIISFDYKYNGMPIITEIDTGSSAIELEILGQEVKRYKRNVRVIESNGETVSIKSFEEILNMVWGDLDRYLNATKSESIVILNDLYLAYFEGNAEFIPVWVVDVIVEDNEGIQDDKKYIIGAEEGVILAEQ